MIGGWAYCVTAARPSFLPLMRKILTTSGSMRRPRMTSYETIQTDLKNAGAQWVDEPVVNDGGIVTSRKPADIPMFNDKMIEEIMEGRHEARKVA